MQATKLDEIHFKQVQGINLNYLTKSNDSETSALELEQLRAIALSHTPSSGYAYSLYFKITGVLLDFPEISFSDRPVSPRSSSAIGKKLRLYPNPVRDNLILDNPENVEIEKIEIFNLSGTNVYNVDTGEIDMKIDVSSLESGIYITYLTFNDGHQRVYKIIKI